MKSVQELGTSIEAKELARLPQLTGRVWEYSTLRVSKSNCIASKRGMLQVRISSCALAAALIMLTANVGLWMRTVRHHDQLDH